MEDWHNPMQRGITKHNRLEANSSPIAEPSVKAVSLKRNKTMNKNYYVTKKVSDFKERYEVVEVIGIKGGSAKGVVIFKSESLKECKDCFNKIKENKS